MYMQVVFPLLPCPGFLFRGGGEAGGVTFFILRDESFPAWKSALVEVYRLNYLNSLVHS